MGPGPVQPGVSLDVTTNGDAKDAEAPSYCETRLEKRFKGYHGSTGPAGKNFNGTKETEKKKDEATDGKAHPNVNPTDADLFTSVVGVDAGGWW